MTGHVKGVAILLCVIYFTGMRQLYNLHLLVIYFYSHFVLICCQHVNKAHKNVFHLE